MVRFNWQKFPLVISCKSTLSLSTAPYAVQLILLFSSSSSHFQQMRPPTTVPCCASLLDACIATKSLVTLVQIHAQAISRGINLNDFIRSKLVSAYASCNQMHQATNLFYTTNRQSTFLYNSIIRAYASLHEFSCSLAFFRRMLDAGKPIDPHTLPSILKCCAGLSASRLGQQVHGVVLTSGFASDLANSNALINLYSKCGDLGSAQKVFDKMPKRNEVSWTTMMAARGMHGKAGEVLYMFEKMVEEGMRLDGACFTVVLSACSHGGMVEKGIEYFRMMEERFGVKAGLEHYTCMVDMLGRAGRVEEAEDLVMGMGIEPDRALVTALLGSCRVHNKLEVAQRVQHELSNRTGIAINRNLFPQTVYPNKWSIGVNQKAPRFCTKAGSGGVGVPTSVPATVAHELLLSGHRFLDVRTAEEFSAGHAVGAVNIPYLYRVGLGMAKNPKFLEEVASHFGKTDEILVGCQIGKRSMMAATELLADGYTGVVDVAGGHIAWTHNGLPTEN